MAFGTSSSVINEAQNFPSEMILTLADLEGNFEEAACCGINWK